MTIPVAPSTHRVGPVGPVGPVGFPARALFTRRPSLVVLALLVLLAGSAVRTPVQGLLAVGLASVFAARCWMIAHLAHLARPIGG
jgi:hypothetical protein